MPEAQLGSAIVLTYRKPHGRQDGAALVLNYNAGAEDPYFVPMFGERRGQWGGSRLATLMVTSSMPETGVISVGPQSPWGTSQTLSGESESGWTAPGQYGDTKEATWASTDVLEAHDDLLLWGKSKSSSEEVKSVMDQNTPMKHKGDVVIPWGKSKPNVQSTALAWDKSVWLRRRSEFWIPWGISFPVMNEGKYPWDRKAPSHDIPWAIVYPSGPVTDEHGTIIIAIKKAYIMQNDITARTVDGNVEIPLQSVSLNIDYSTWAWGFQATVPAAYLNNLQSSGLLSPVELMVSVNGEDFLVIVESVSRSREFGKASLNISGRGHSAYLSDPYVAPRHYSNSAPLTCRQLFEDALTINTAPLGWNVNWMIPDWLVPAGAWDYSGTYIQAITEIASSVGAYIQPDPKLKTLNVLSKYPTLPSEWSSGAPYLILPTAVVQKEGYEWIEKPNYNGVYVVGGETGGIIAMVKKDGTIGDFLAEQYEHQLITHTDAAREKGRSVLAYTGKMANVTLSVPILDDMGLVHPGNVIRYRDGLNSIYGITRSLSITSNGVSARQTIGVEVHPNA